MASAVTSNVARQPALDGVRGLAVALVLLFHHGWLSGGYVGVSVFFTLSGYLITALALAEHDRTGRLDVRAFYGRRARRLLPASVVCLLGVVALAVAGVVDGVEHLRRDLWAALAQVSNWVALGGGESYADVVAGVDAARSPLDHYWSLAIEQQFYWIWPLVLVAVLSRPARARIALVAAMAAVLAVSAPVIAATWGPDAAYWATPARLAEILVGAVLATVLHARAGRALPAATRLLAPVGLLVIGWAAIAWPSGSGPAYDGWLPAFAVATAALITGVQVPGGMATVLAGRPLVALGVVSYGVYLFHWPVFVVLDEARTGLPTVPLLILRLAVTLAVAMASYRWIEVPLRRVRPRRHVVPVGAAAACLATATAVVLVPAVATPYWMTADATSALPAPPGAVEPLRSGAPAAGAADHAAPAGAPAATATAGAGDEAPADTTPDEAAPAPAGAASAPAAAPPTTAPTTTPPATAPAPPVAPPLPPPPTRPVRILVVGDSTAMATAAGLTAWAEDHPDLAQVGSIASPGCGIIPDGRLASDLGDIFGGPCAAARDRIPETLESLRPDVVVGMVTLADVDTRTWDDAEGPLAPDDPRFYERLVAAYDDATARFLAAGATDVLWLEPPVPTVPFGPDQAQFNEPWRYDRYAAALGEVAARHPGRAAVVDVPAWAGTQPVPPERPDGVHWSDEGSRVLADALLGPMAVTAALT